MLMQRGIGLLAVAVGLVIAAIHILTILGRPPVGELAVIGLAFPVAALACLSYIAAVNRHGAMPQRPPRSVFAIWTALAIYTPINFWIGQQSTLGGHVETSEGKSMLVVHGRQIRELDATGVRSVEVAVTRAIAGHMLPFLLIPGLALLYAIPRSSSRPGRPNER